MKEIDFRYDLLPLKNKLFRLAQRITLDSAEAEDVTQDTLLRVWEKRHELPPLQSLEAYCLTICRNLAIDRCQKKVAQSLSIEEVQVDAPDNAPAPDELLIQDERLQRVKKIFNQLPLAQRTAIQLRDIEGKTYREVAAIMGVTEENIKVILHRARTAVRKEYEKYENYGL